MRRLLPATLLVSAGAISYELLLMRLLSIVQWHHFAYMVISLALLGYGASGTFIALFRQRLESRFEAVFRLAALLFSISMPVCFALGQRVPFNALEVAWDVRQLGYLSLMYLAFFVPFFFAAICIGLAFTCHGRLAGRIYFFDLVGAGLGAVVLIGLLFLLMPEHALLPVLALPFAASLLMTSRPLEQRTIAVLQLAWLGLLVVGLPQTYTRLEVSEFKGLSQALAVLDSRVLEKRSSPLGLITVVESPTIPLRHAPGLSFATAHIPPEQLGVFTDADAMSAIIRFDGRPESLAWLGDTTAALPFALLEAPSVLVLGAGGGSDVLLALSHGAKHVDAVELDPQMIALVAGTYADFAGNVYADPRVTVHAAEARGFIAQTDKQYDLLHIGLLDSFAASGAGVQSLNESYIYTVEALTGYIRRTRPDGIVAITRWLKLPPRDSLKLIGTAIEALRAEGIEAPGRRLALIRGWNTVTLLIRNGDFLQADVEAIREFAAARSFDTAWLPGLTISDTNRYNVLDEPYLFNGTEALLGDDAAAFMARYKFDIEPATDDRPYFFHLFRWRTLPEIFALREVGGAALIEWGYLILVLTLLQAVLAGLLLILIPLTRIDRSWPAGTAPRMGGYFLLLGLAFLFVEIAFIQKFILFLSHPLYAVAVVLAGFLVFAGIGSAYSDRFSRRLESGGRSAVTVAVAAIALVSLAYVLLLPTVFAKLIGTPDAIRIALSIALIAPLAFFMGMPFPLGLARVAEKAPAFLPWAWGINGFASVVAAVLATLLAIELGFSVVIVIALGLYALAALLMAPGNNDKDIRRSSALVADDAT